MERSRFGYDMVTSGHQESAATYSGVGAKRTVVMTMALSGMVAGIAGAVFAIMIQGYYTDPSGIGTYGFDAIAVSLLAANNPIWNHSGRVIIRRSRVCRVAHRYLH